MNNAGQPPEVLVAGIRKLLRPLVRLMLSFQITYPFVINMLKSIYVEVADEEFKFGDKRQSDSRINLLTGVHRKDVKRLRAESDELLCIPRNISIGAQLIAYWLGSEEFLDETGHPMPLPLRNAPQKSDSRSFDDLVEIVCKQDIRPRVILDEWLNSGVARLDENQRVILNTGAFTPEKGFEEKAFFFGKNIHDHLSASTQNLMGHKPSYFDRSVYYDNLSFDSVQHLSQLANEVGMNALVTVNKRALALQKQDQLKTDKDHRINFGIFNYNTVYKSDALDKEGEHNA
ncbi:MAG: DUF6502 family protein [Gammaproteobacteria bacterium]|nr:DUF6502 family protein [Gammaproteobacteria bacterium]MDP2141018.1 DUF6502 family protein [Gammaproteobacteria bacterium]MDP2349238.1 DUF6502 family protein [Gammaproteobacteria bacterium]